LLRSNARKYKQQELMFRYFPYGFSAIGALFTPHTATKPELQAFMKIQKVRLWI